jgi:small-conductance mechanosensitive channel
MSALDSTPLLVGTTAAVVLVLLGPIIQFVLHRRGRTRFAADLRGLRWPIRWFAVALVARSAAIVADEQWATPLSKALLIATVAWVIVRALVVVQGVVFRRLHIDAADNLRARSRRTQVELVRRIVSVIVVVGALAVTLLTLTPLGRAGTTIVTYAGVIGILAGVALRSPIENLAAGVIVAFTEPIRIDDVVVVEGEWGRIESIGLVNVSVRVWDDRRLVLPTSRFVDEPFENWTRSSSALTGTVTAWLDHSVDLDALRREVDAFLAGTRLWDGRSSTIQVVELGERAVQVRILVTAADAPALWDLRCELREALLPHLAGRDDELPVVRLREHERPADRTPVLADAGRDGSR